MLSKKLKALAVLFLLLFTIVALIGCGQETPEQESSGDSGPSGSGGGTPASGGKIILGWVSPLTGTAANQGQQLLDGANLAVKEINEAGGINGKMLELDPQDDKSDPKEAANIATKFTSDDRILGVVGNYNSSCALAGFPIYNEAGLPMITVGTSPVITEQHGPYCFRLAVTDAFQGKYVTEWLFEDGFSKPAILYENNDYGRGLMEVVEAEVKNLGGEVAIKETYMMGETKDFTAILTKVKASDADCLFIAGLYNEGALITKQARQLGIDLPVYSNEALFEQIYIDLAGEAAEGTKVCGLLVPSDPDPVVQKFFTAYDKEYGKLAGTFSAFGYDMVKIFARAIEEVGEDREKITEYLKNMPEYEGASGRITFDEEHDAVRPTLKRIIVRNGNFELVQ